MILSSCTAKAETIAEKVPDPETAAVTTGNAAPVRDGGGAAVLQQLYDSAAEQLKVTVEALTEALGTPPNFEAAAEKLGIAIEKLQEAMPQLARGGFGGGGGISGRDQIFAQAAEALKVSVEDLVNALGRPLNLEAAAEKLKIPVEKLEEALPKFGGRAGQRAPAGNQ